MNRKMLLLILILITGAIARPQKRASIHLSIGSGVSYFRGSGTVNNSVLYRNGLPFPYTYDSISNSFGRQPYTNLSAGLQFNLKILPSWMLTIDAQYEHSGGELSIDSVYSPATNYKTSGVHQRRYDYISVNPQLSRKISLGPAGFRFSAGVDYCIKVSRGVQSDFIDESGRKFSSGGSGDAPEINDIRLTGGLALNLGKWALAAVYKHGLVDYAEPEPGKVYSRLLHIRLLYRLLGK